VVNVTSTGNAAGPGSTAALNTAGADAITVDMAVAASVVSVASTGAEVSGVTSADTGL
jgi:hypothetical protein